MPAFIRHSGQLFRGVTDSAQHFDSRSQSCLSIGKWEIETAYTGNA